MRILIVCNGLPPDVVGGAEFAVRSLALLLAEHGHDVRIATKALSDECCRVWRATPVGVAGILDDTRGTGFQTAARKGVPRIRGHLLDHFKFWGFGALENLIREFRPDIVNVHNIQSIGYRIIDVLARAGVPVCHTTHDLGAICINLARFRNGSECEGQCMPCALSQSIKSKLWHRVPRLGVLSPSQALMDSISSAFPKGARRAVIPLPLKFSAASPALKKIAPIEIVFAGKIDATKGIHFILEALSQLSNAGSFRFNILGTGSLLAELRQQYASSAWVNFVGLVKPEEVAAHMQMADLIVVPSLWKENSPLVIYEALHHRKPVFASRIGGMPELLATGGGILITPGSQADWKRALSRFLSDQVWRAELVESAARGSKYLAAERNLGLVTQFFSAVIG